MTLDLAERQRCSICGAEYVWDHQHRCSADVQRALDAQLRQAMKEMGIEVAQSYGQRLHDGFRMMRGEYT